MIYLREFSRNRPLADNATMQVSGSQGRTRVSGGVPLQRVTTVLWLAGTSACAFSSGTVGDWEPCSLRMPSNCIAKFSVVAS